MFFARNLAEEKLNFIPFSSGGQIESASGFGNFLLHARASFSHSEK
jgi:hypothetical protein